MSYIAQGPIEADWISLFRIFASYPCKLPYPFQHCTLIIMVILPVFVDPLHFGTVPDPAYFVSGKDKKSKSNQNIAEIKVFLTFLLVDGRTRIQEA